jgi:hypothetical protein
MPQMVGQQMIPPQQNVKLYFWKKNLKFSIKLTIIQPNQLPPANQDNISKVKSLIIPLRESLKVKINKLGETKAKITFLCFQNIFQSSAQLLNQDCSGNAWVSYHLLFNESVPGFYFDKI